MPSINVHPCQRHTETATQTSAVVCVIAVPVLSSPLSLSASPIHVLPGSGPLLDSHTPLGRMQNQTVQSEKICLDIHPPTVTLSLND